MISSKKLNTAAIALPCLLAFQGGQAADGCFDSGSAGNHGSEFYGEADHTTGRMSVMHSGSTAQQVYWIYWTRPIGQSLGIDDAGDEWSTGYYVIEDTLGECGVPSGLEQVGYTLGDWENEDWCSAFLSDNT